MARVEKRRGVYRLLGNMRKRDHLDDVIDGRVLLKCIFKNWDGRAWTGLIWLRIRTKVDACKWGKEPSGSIKCGNFLTS